MTNRSSFKGSIVSIIEQLEQCDAELQSKELQNKNLLELIDKCGREKEEIDAKTKEIDKERERQSKTNNQKIKMIKEIQKKLSEKRKEIGAMNEENDCLQKV